MAAIATRRCFRGDHSSSAMKKSERFSMVDACIGDLSKNESCAFREARLSGLIKVCFGLVRKPLI